MKLTIPEFALVALIGPSGAGKSTFARTHFKPTEVISSDYCRGLVSDDENDQGATNDAFEVLHYIAAKRLANRRLTVIDATNVRADDRKALIRLAREHHALPVALVFDMPARLCLDRNEGRPDRQFGSHVVRNQLRALRQSRRGLKKEGFRQIQTFKTEEEVDAVTIERQRLWTDRRDETGPFDIIGDIHGCFDELTSLLTELGYGIDEGLDDDGAARYAVTPPDGRRVVFLGDLVDRGPRVPDVLRLAMSMVEAGTAICVPGNHENKLLRWLNGRNVQTTHGLAETIAQLEAEPEAIRESFKKDVARFIDSLVSHCVLDDGRLVVAHAGMKEDMQGRASGAVRQFALYGETTGEIDEFGLPVRHDWASDYRGQAMVAYGHTPMPEAEWLNRTICLDTGCVFGGKLTALRYPERELVSVPAAKVYAEPMRPLEPEPAAPAGSLQHEHDTLLHLEDVFGKRIIRTSHRHNVIVREENAAAALEIMSRFAADPRWLIYLPPTMSPTETSPLDDYLEHPAEAFDYFRSQGVDQVVCEEKHMGSRAVIVVCRDEDEAARRFGVANGEAGIIYTRTGRRFFDDMAVERALLGRVRGALDGSAFWDAFETGWACIDCELMPWSAKAQELLDRQYAPVGVAAQAGLAAAETALAGAVAQGVDVEGLRDTLADRRVMADQYVAAYRQYCWTVDTLDDYRIAPFHLLATEGRVHADKDHVWHMETLKTHCNPDGEPVLQTTKYRLVDLARDKDVADAIDWWVAMTEAGGEGMVVKPKAFVTLASRGLVQPAVKCRGREYLRIIYGPEYTRPEYLKRLKKRGLGRKRSLASREFALGIEGLERFVQNEPLRRVHECVFGVLAMESEPVDPRL